MKTLEEFLSELAKLDIKVWVEDDRLRCNAPKDVLTQDLRQQLVEHKAEIMALLGRVEGDSNSTESIRPVPRNFDEGIPLSFAQTRLWFIDQLEGEERAGYYMRWPFHITGKLNVAALERAIKEIVRRHEILRTSFKLVNGNPVQVIEPRVSINLSIVDCRDLFGAEFSLSTIPSEIQRLVELEAQQPFDLAKGPLLRATLWQLTEESHILMLAMHHIVYDGWSMPIFFKELSELYAAFSKGEPSPLPELPIQYADFAVWQRHWLSGEVLQTQLDYWKQQLKGAPTLLELPTDRPRRAIQTCQGAYRVEALSFELSEELALLSRRTGVTLFMTLLAAFGTLLYRYTRQEDICVGTPIANRNREEIEGLIGFFVNTLVMRIDFSGNPSFAQLLSRVREVALGAYAHQDMPFEELIQTLQPERSLSHTPLFQVMFQFQNEPVDSSWELPDLTVSSSTVELRTAIFDLTLSMQNTSQGLIAEWEYNSDLFDDDTIARMAGHFQTLLSGIVAYPDGRISEISLLTKAERHQLLVSWNATQREYPQDKCIHQLFEEQVKRTPDAVAVVFEGEHLTYQQLNAKTNQLAHYLQSLGVGPEVLVGICAERSLLMVIGLLGILKAGGAYVPLDPAYPPERLAYMLSDARVSLLLTQGQLVELLSQSGAQLICLDRDWKAIACSSESNPVTSVKASNLAYAIYTSGSTGSPKGVAIEHRSLVNFTLAAKVEYGINSRDSVLQFSTISFDVAAEEIYTCLASGGTLVLRTDEMLNSVSTFVQKCQEWQLTVLDLPIAYWHQLTSELADTEEMLPSSVRLVIIGGEAVQKETLKLWQKCVDDMLLRDQLLEPPLLMNAYGPTEATVAATICLLSESVLKNKQSKVPIGRPLSNVEAYILDRNLQPVPIGSSGELYIGGVCLARGYLNRPDLTAERFIPNPFSPILGDRLYKTGDLVRYLPDSNLEFLGRTDHQVKLRGFRIELGELEAVLRQHPVVEEAVVLALQEDSGQVQSITPRSQQALSIPTGDSFSSTNRLIAYVTTKQKQPLTSGELRSFLQKDLPEYMMPSAYVVLDEFPLSPNGKVDRRALASETRHHLRDKSQRSLEKGFVAPRDFLELQLAQIWSDVLDVYPISVWDNFFDLGGHSLLAIRLMSQIQQQLEKNLPLMTLSQGGTEEMNFKVSIKLLFKHPNIAELAEALSHLLTPVRSLNRQQSQAKVKELMTASSTKTTDLSPFLKLEQRSLLSLFAVGKVASVDSAALGYIPLSILKETTLTRNEILQIWCDNLPTWDAVMETKWGRIAVINLPIFEDELYNDPQKLVQMAVEALEMAGRLGAKTVSLTGLIPSATDYGRAIVKAVEGRNDLPKITTGHATTCATVVLTIKKILQVSQRSLEREKVAFIGLGSVGVSTLRLMLKCLPHPTEITLCDVYSKLEFIEKIQQELIYNFGFQGLIRIAASASELPSEIYDATLIIGATNVPEILDIDLVKSGTLIVDDSGPHCFSPEQAISRFEEQKDILFTEGGVLQAPYPIETVIYLPEFIKNNMAQDLWKAYWPSNPAHITGCVLSSLFSSCFDYMEPTVGLLNMEICVQHYQGLEQLGFQAADLHCEGYVLPVEPK